MKYTDLRLHSVYNDNSKRIAIILACILVFVHRIQL